MFWRTGRASGRGGDKEVGGQGDEGKRGFPQRRPAGGRARAGHTKAPAHGERPGLFCARPASVSRG